MASLLFGSEVTKEKVIGETLSRITPGNDINDHEFIRTLSRDIQNEKYSPPIEYSAFINEPLSELSG